MSALAAVIERSRREREDWRYTDLGKLLGAKNVAAKPVVAARELPSLVGAAHRRRIVFIDGVLSREQTQFGDLPAAVLQGDAAGGYRLELAAQSCLVTAPIELVFASERGESGVAIAVDVGANASVTIVEHHIALGAQATAQVIDCDIRLGAQAKLVHEKIMHAAADEAHFARARVRVEEGAYYRSFDLIKDARLARREIEVTLAGALAQCGLYGVMLLGGREHADLQTRVIHAAPHGSSQQLYKAVLKDSARGVFQGRIKVEEGAQKTDGRQLCRALLLSDKAEMDAKPELEIYADDVACSHGCAVGDIDADAMFYLRSRGLNEAQARGLLLRAFVDEAIDSIQAEDARGYVQNLAGGWMHDEG